jgi:hypothetical protein
MRGSDASEAQRCHELIPIGILKDNNSATILLHTRLSSYGQQFWDNNSATILLHTRLDNSIAYTCVVVDTPVSRITRLDNSIACSVIPSQGLQLQCS